jgi:hypothetical protein
MKDVKEQRKKKSRIWLTSSEEFLKIYESSSTIREILTKLGYSGGWGNSRVMLRERIVFEGLDPVDGRVGRVSQFRKSLDEILVVDSKYRRSCLKRQLMRENLLGTVCSICGIEPVWDEKPLVLILDHINGVHNDDRIENLRLVCPNCNSQLPPFAGRNRKSSQSSADGD